MSMLLDDISDDDDDYLYPQVEEYSIFYSRCFWHQWREWFLANLDKLEYHDPMSFDSPQIWFKYQGMNIFLSYWNGYVICSTFENYHQQKKEYSETKPYEFNVLSSITDTNVEWDNHRTCFNPWEDSVYKHVMGKIRNKRTPISRQHQNLLSLLQEKKTEKIKDNVWYQWFNNPKFRFTSIT